MRTRIAVVLLCLLAATFVVQAAPRLNQPFGLSNDGFNASVWSLGSRAVRSEGLVGSKLGAEFDWDSSRRAYAHHPPLIYSAVALAELFLGERPVAARLPVVVSSVALIFVAFLLLRALGVDPLVAAVAVCVCLSAPMFLVYGAVPDTIMLSLVLAALLLLLWQRHLTGRAVSPVAIGVVAALSCLTSWQGMLVAGLVSASAARRQIHQRHVVHAAVVLSSVLASLFVFAWVLWVYGSFAELLDVSTLRVSRSVSPLRSLRLQLRYLLELAPVLFVALPLAAVVAVTDQRAREVTVMAVAAVAAGAQIFRNGAAFHDYWNYWALLPALLGMGLGVDWLFRRGPKQPSLIALSALCAVAVVVGLLFTARAPARQAIVRGWPSGKALASSASRWPPSQRLAYYDAAEASVPMLSYYSRRVPVRITRRSLSEVCTDPRYLVFDASARLVPCADATTSGGRPPGG